ncbi:hypothetical protein B0J11DRAFT_529966 [Dendryphion nanum]|uniref:DUF7707 domain-containing protein n=1 Tax=Dendryphion nanum TaxID=256645 RepID=A0A9P9DRP4_9PLEO|nr:hypothetical protein B0J11DRAFT_529966 [Dendryphion nanum]
MRSFLTLAVAALSGIVAAQYTIDPETVRQSDRDAWCQNQKSQCPLICLQQPGVTSLSTVSNTCDSKTLAYSCVCSNNVAPNITEYSQTIPYYICTQWGSNCVKACGNVNTCQDACRKDHPCGAQSPQPPNSSILAATSASQTAAGAAQSTLPPASGWGGSAATSTPNKPGAATTMANLGQSYGLAVVFASVFAGFAILL